MFGIWPGGVFARQGDFHLSVGWNQESDVENEELLGCEDAEQQGWGRPGKLRKEGLGEALLCTVN